MNALSRYLPGISALTLLATFGCSNPPESERNKPGGQARDQTGLRKITPAELRFDPNRSTAVISGAQKFIIPIPAFGGAAEPLVYPKGHRKAGQPILDFEGKSIGKKGLVFFNANDQTVQAVAGDGEGVIIINEVTEEQAEKLHQKINEFQPDPNKLTLSQMKQVLDFARTQLKLGDMYNSTRSFVRSKMTPAVAGEVPRVEGKEIADYGLKKRDDRDVCHAVYVPGKFAFEGPAASPQIFENGGVIVEHEGEFRGVQPEIFVRTYRLLDGRPITSLTDDLKTWRQE
jgi:hypothetical protein